MAKYPVQFAQPVFFGESPHLSPAASINNATATLLKLQDRFLGVTCQHVLEGYRRSKATRKTVFQLGPVQLDPERHLISEDRDHDLAIFDLTPFVGAFEGLATAKFVEPSTWPPESVSTSDVLCLGGFPGIWREQVGPGHLRFYSYSTGAGEVFSVVDDKIVTRVQLQDCISQINDGKVWGSLGGLSGSPVFAWRNTPILVAEFVGIVYEYQESLDLMFVRAAKVILQDGSLI
jgi:hypothetical protein